VHRNNILIYTQQDATLHSLLYLETALHVSDSTTTHHQERKQLYLQHLVFATPLLLPAVIVEELEPVWVCCEWRSHFRHRISKIILLCLLVYGCDTVFSMEIVHLLYFFFRIIASQKLVSSSLFRGQDPVKNPTVVFHGTVGLEPWNKLFTVSNKFLPQSQICVFLFTVYVHLRYPLVVSSDREVLLQTLIDAHSK
jgi:hypothetical protein